MTERHGTEEEEFLKRAYMLTPVNENDEGRPSRRGLASYYIAFLWRRRLWIAALALLCGFAGLAFGLWRGKIYRATATLILRAPRFTSELRTEPFSVETYKSVFESSLMMRKLKTNLLASKTIPENTALEDLASELTVQIYPNRETDQPGARPFMPILDLIAEARKPNVAAEMANAWAHLAVEENARLSNSVARTTLDFIEKQYPTAFKDLMAKEEELKSVTDSHENELLVEKVDWLERISRFAIKGEKEQTAFRNETEAKLTEFSTETARIEKDHNLETERLKKLFLTEWNPELAKKKRAILESKLADYKDDLLETELDILTQEEVLRTLQKEISTQPQLLTLSKAINDEALWNEIGKANNSQLASVLKDLKLSSELLNPTYQTLLDRLIATQIRTETLGPQKTHLEQESARIEAQIASLQEEIARKELEFYDLASTRELELRNILQDRAVREKNLARERETQGRALELQFQAEMDMLESQKDTQLAELKRRGDLSIASVEREVTALKKEYELLAEKYGSAQLARAEEPTEVNIGALAVEPEKPVGAGPLAWFAVAFAAGFLLSTLALVGVAFFQVHIAPVLVELPTGQPAASSRLISPAKEAPERERTPGSALAGGRKA